MPALLQHCNINHKIGSRDMLNSYKIFNFYDLCQKLHENHRPYKIYDENAILALF